MGSIFFYLVGALLLFTPVSLVCAELSTGWPEEGGVYVWIREAFGEKMAFLSIWLLWVENVVWYPTILSFLAGTLAYVFSPNLAGNKIYTYFCIVAIFWIASLINLRGMKTSSIVTNISVIFGTILPGAAIIIMGIGYVWMGEPVVMDMSFPDLGHVSSWVLLVGVLLGFGGMEVSAIHANDVEKPQRDYPRAIMLSGLLILTLSVLGTLAIAAVVPRSTLTLHAGGMEAIAHFLRAYELEFLTKPFAFLIALGAFGGVSSWLVGPSRGLLAAAKSGDFPPFFHNENKHGMPKTIILVQACIVSVISLLFLFVPSINDSFWILIAISAQVYLVMYAILFAAAIRLRYKARHIERSYRVPGGNAGMWITCSVGIFTCVSCFFLGFVPPEQLAIANFIFFESVMVVSILLLIALPYIILRFKKESWNE